MRILTLSPYEPPPDGIARHTAEIVRSWDASGHTVLVLAPRVGRSAGTRESIGSHSSLVRALEWRLTEELWGELADFRPDMVFVQFAISALTTSIGSALTVCRRFVRTGTPVVVGFHEAAREYSLIPVATGLLYRSIARVTTVPVAFSSEGRRALMGIGLFTDVALVPHGTSDGPTVAADDLERVRARYGVTKPLVVSLGFVSADKGIDKLIRAAPAISAHREGDVQFLVAGGPRRRRGAFRLREWGDVSYHRRLVREARRAVGVDITFTGYVPDADVRPLLRVADVVVLAYRSITQSGIAHLALASHAVVVSADLAGLRSDLGEAARYVDVDEEEALESAVEGLLGPENREARAQLRERAATRATLGTFDEVANAILALGRPPEVGRS